MPPILGALAAAGAAAIGAAGTLLAGAASFLGGGSLLAGIVKIGFSMAAQYVLGSLFAPKPTAQAARLETTYGDRRPREVILGRVGIAGHHVFRNARGSGNRLVTDVYRVSDFRISGISRALGDGYWRTLDADVDDIINGVQIRKHYGTDAVADAWLVANSGGRWKSTSVGLGVSYFIIDSYLSLEGKTTPHQPLVEVYGPFLYDWRKDTSVGGDGEDRWNDQETWSGDRENPVLQMYLLERGVFVNGSLIVGKGVNPARLPLAEWTVAANICEEEVGVCSAVSFINHRAVRRRFNTRFQHAAVAGSVLGILGGRRNRRVPDCRGTAGGYCDVHRRRLGRGRAFTFLRETPTH